MRTLTLLTATALLLTAAAGASRAADEPAKRADKKPESSCGTHGTSVEFVGTPSEAAKKALKEEKLVFVLHVSGHFEDPGLT